MATELPKPDREGMVDGWRSRIWQRRSFAIRLRTKGDAAIWTTFPDGGEQKGTLELGELWTLAWLSGNPA